MDLHPRRKKKRRPHISSEASQDVKSQQSKKRESDSPKLDPDPKRRRLSKAKHLDLHTFVSLPQTVMARVWRYLHPVDVLSLSRTCKPLRTIFMSKHSKPCWDECRFQQEIPDWNHVSAPQVLAFLYEKTCQGVGCDEPRFLGCVYVCRQYCAGCARAKLFDVADVRRKWPDLPQDLVTRLPWTPKRPDVSMNDSIQGRFYLEDDILILLGRFQRLKHQPSWTLTALRAELIAKQRARQAAAVEILIWFERSKKRAQRKFNSRWNMISAVMASRWGWSPVPYSDLPGRLKQIVDYLIGLPDVTNDTWERVRWHLTRAIREKRPRVDTPQRPFSLRGTDLASKRETP